MVHKQALLESCGHPLRSRIGTIPQRIPPLPGRFRETFASYVSSVLRNRQEHVALRLLDWYGAGTLRPQFVIVSVTVTHTVLTSPGKPERRATRVLRLIVTIDGESYSFWEERW